MLTENLALVSETSAVSLAEVMVVASALQKQATLDLVPLWGMSATVNPFATLDDVPLTFHPMIIRDDIGYPGAAGIHLDKDGQPFALIQASNSWSLTASHECLEMLADPFGDRLISGPSLMPGQGIVEYLIEIADPPEGPQFGYTIDGILVSDFITERFYDAVPAVGVQYDFTGAISAPRQVLKDGYISWHDPISDHWYQQTFFGDQPIFRDLGILGLLTASQGIRSLREAIDAATPIEFQLHGVPTSPAMLTAASSFVANSEASQSKAAALRVQIEVIKEEAVKNLEAAGMPAAGTAAGTPAEAMGAAGQPGLLLYSSYGEPDNDE